MNHEDYVSFEQAQRLKELGFDWDCMKGYAHYPNENVKTFNAQEENINGKYNEWCYSAPTLAQAAKWLRDVKGIAVCVQSFDSNKDPRYGSFWWKEYFLPNCEERGPQWVEWWISGNHPIFPKYEEALSDGISKMLELIINK